MSPLEQHIVSRVSEIQEALDEIGRKKENSSITQDIYLNAEALAHSHSYEELKLISSVIGFNIPKIKPVKYVTNQGSD